jgi:hypothetical protein
VPDVERILQNTPGSISQQWYEAGVAVDPGTVTVEVTRADGTVLVAGGTGTTGTGTSPRLFNLTTTHTALLDTLKVTWTSTGKGSLVSYLEVVGGFLYSIAEARSLKPLDNTTTYPTASIIAMRTSVEDMIERACGVAFVPRYTHETLTGLGTYGLLPTWPKLRAVRSASATYNGATTTLGASDLLGLTWGAYAGLYGYSWTSGYPWSIGYEHGYDRPPEEIKHAALILTKLKLTGQNRPVDDRAVTFNTSEGGTYSLAVPGRNGSHFGHPDVDAAIDRYSFNAMVA